MPHNSRSFSRRTVLKASTVTVGGLMGAGTAAADESEEVICLDCAAHYDIQDVEIGKAVPPSVTGSATVTQRCSGGEGRVQFYVDGEFAGEEVVEINCVEEATATFEYSPDRPLKPGTYELRVAVLVGTADRVIDEETIEFQVPSGQGRGRGKGRSKGKGKGKGR